jgi:hypothetical protein
MFKTQVPLYYCGGKFSIFVLQLATFAWSGWAACYGTPQAAIDGAVGGTLSASKAGENGYKVIKVQRDELLRRSWAMVANCEHPEWSVIALPISSSSSIEFMRSFPSIAQLPIVVRAGDTVRLWRREALLQITVNGVSEENGSLGNTVLVRLPQRSIDSISPPEEFTGVVRGPSNVEMQP